MNLKDAIRTLLFKKKAIGFNQLYTPWGEQIDPEKILTEYPRPQLRRDNYTILNGYWNYCISSGHVMPMAYAGRILVPFSPESVLSGVDRQLQPDEFFWYERILTIDWMQWNKRCILHFGAVDQSCEVYINHQRVGGHVGGYLPFSFDITKYLEVGTNLITLKVWDVSDTSYHSRGKQKLNRGGMWYTAQSGIWQTVWLEWVPDLYIKSLRITPLVDEKAVQLEIRMNDDFRRDRVYEVIYQVEIYSDGNRVGALVTRNPFMRIPLTELLLWSPEQPHLYDLKIVVNEDQVDSYFAMRKVEIKNGEDNIPRIYLNNQPYFQNGLLDQGYWPDGLYTAPSDEALIFDIMKAKELGFNMLRKHIKIEPLRWYYHCDRLGMLVWQDMVNGGEEYRAMIISYLPNFFPRIASLVKDSRYKLFGREDIQGRREWVRECEQTVEHLYNCPSIVAWVPFNEGWGQFDAVKVYEFIRGLDPTRLVDHASGWYDQKCGDFTSIHNYFSQLTVKAGHRPFVLSEFGGYACYILGHSYSLLVFGYRIYLTKEELDEAYHTSMEEGVKQLIEKGLSAAVYTQLSDVEDEVNGLLTYDRKVCKVTPIHL
ncbi:MAG TPA: glycoside hydrolase family 2 [Clostridiales bacterium]|nr:glycoside hydrolase family 2 [Clostridiales bacterium]